MKYAHIIDTKLQGWYDEEINAVIPTPNIEVTDEVWQEAINTNANCYEDGKFIVKDFRTVEEIRTAEINTQIAEAKQYLADTGWYIERLNDPSSGKAIPEEVLVKRAESRELINTLEVELGGL